MSAATTTPAVVTMCRVEQLAAVGAAVSALEHLASPALFRDDGVLGWPTARTRHRWMSGRLRRPLDAVFGERGVRVLLVSRVAAAAVLASGVAARPLRLLCAGHLALTGHALALRTPYGSDGAESMVSVVLTASALSRAAGVDERTATLFLRFVTAQATFSYLVAGVAKAGAPLWFDGTAVRDVLRTRIFGHERLYELVRARPRLTRLLSRAVTLAELAFPLVLLLPPRARTLALAAMASFHAVNAGAMGLNRFVWAFVATYPAIGRR